MIAKSSTEPYIITFPKIGDTSLGYISVAENETLPFPVKRIYWTYFTPESVERGGHAHYELEQVLIAVSGKIIVSSELVNGKKTTYALDNPYMGLFVPKMSWHTMKYSHNAVQVALASSEYNEKDYIRNYYEFLTLQNRLSDTTPK